MNTPTIQSKKRQAQEAIDRAIAEFVANGGKIRREEIGKTKSVGLTWRNYASAALQEGEEE